MALIEAPAREPQATDTQIIAFALDNGYLKPEEVRKVALAILGLPADEPNDTPAK